MADDWPRIIDVGLRDPQRPKLGQWAKWLTPANRLVVTTTVWTKPIEDWFATARNYVRVTFDDDFKELK
jgi:hypothetical protein